MTHVLGYILKLDLGPLDINSHFRFKREEIKIQAWESQQKAKLDAEMRRIEV